MTDMLVKLYELPPLEPVLTDQKTKGITVRRALVPEKHLVLEWVRAEFSEYWVDECNAAFARQPVTCFIAVYEGAVIGFACSDATGLGFFGPTGVSEAARGKSTGKALLLVSLHDMYNRGYGYAIIGGVGPIEFYEKGCGATVIPDSTPSIYAGLLQSKADS